MGKESTAYLLRCYIWLADVIYTAGHITREEINRKWYHNDTVNPDHHSEIPERTFHNWKDGIQALFQINIKCDRALGRSYYIEDAEDLKQAGVRQWLINTFAVNNLINESHALRNQILFEHIPSGHKFLTPIIEAMRDKIKINLTYQSFNSQEPHTFMVLPYCVKVFRQRWYMVAKHDFHKDLRIYALDRIFEVTPTDESYNIPKKFDGEEYFGKVYGITVPEEEQEFVDVKVDEYQANYFRSLPIHDSQKEVERNEDYSIFRFFLIPNFEFRKEILSYGSDVEILSPKWLRDEVRDEIAALVELYNN